MVIAAALVNNNVILYKNNTFSEGHNQWVFPSSEPGFSIMSTIITTHHFLVRKISKVKGDLYRTDRIEMKYLYNTETVVTLIIFSNILRVLTS